jgi:nitrate/TMAO reductase-like tetraheme cytochrome c subunit
MENDRKRTILDTTVWSLGVVVASALVAHEAFARNEAFEVTNPSYQTECGSCHVAYPPALLPAGSWQAILNGLDKHFGTDASVDAKSLAELRAFLNSNAGRDRRASAWMPGPRITETDWFRREHREVPEATWKGAAVKGPANCAACHTGAENGDYSERGIRVPK